MLSKIGNIVSLSIVILLEGHPSTNEFQLKMFHFNSNEQNLGLKWEIEGLGNIFLTFIGIFLPNSLDQNNKKWNDFWVFQSLKVRQNK